MKSDPILHELQKNTVIREAQKMALTPELRKKLDPESSKQVASSQRQIDVYRIVYTSQKHAVVGYIALPKKRAATIPAIIYNRGGTGEFGMLRTLQIFTGTMATLARAGYVVVATQYSGVAGGEGRDEMGGADLADVLTLRKVIQGLSCCKNTPIGMCGFSRGGIMTYQALRDASWIRAAVVVSAPTDLIYNETYRSEMREHHKKMFGGSVAEKKKRSVMYWPEKLPITTPLQILCGMKDSRVHPQESFRLAEKIAGRLRSFKLVAYPNGSHTLEEHKSEADEETISWFDTYLKK